MDILFHCKIKYIHIFNKMSEMENSSTLSNFQKIILYMKFEEIDSKKIMEFEKI